MKYILLVATFTTSVAGIAQNVGIGTSSPTKAKLEVHGTSGAGRTSGILGGDLGISLQRNIPAIGFNQYRDDSLDNNNGRYLSTGYAAVLSYTHNNPNLSQGLDYFVYPSGTANSLVPAGIRPLSMSSNGRTDIMTDGNAVLDVGRSTGFEGTAMFLGSSYNSHFNYSTGENTYIRAGKSNNVYINDIAGGKITFGDGATRVGVNTTTPVYPLEIRQVAGTGIRMANAPYPTQTWEWRVSGSPTNFYLYHIGAIKTYFSPNDGSLHPVSDGRLKTNIHSLTSVLDNILKLRPVSYEMINDNPDHVRSIGFIAQDVQKLFPQIVDGGSNTGEMLSLQYNGFGVIAIQGIKEEEAHILKLEENTNTAERRLLLIEKKIANRKLQNK